MNRMTHVSVRSARDMSASSFLIGALGEDIKDDRPASSTGRSAFFRLRIECFFDPCLAIYVNIRRLYERDCFSRRGP